MRIILFLVVTFLLASCASHSPQPSLETAVIIDDRDPLPWNQPGYFGSLVAETDYAANELIAIYQMPVPDVDSAITQLNNALLDYLNARGISSDKIRLVDLNSNGVGDAVYSLKSTVPTVKIGTTPVCGQLIARFIYMGFSLNEAIIALNDLTPGGYLPQGNSLYGISPKGRGRITSQGNYLTPAFTTNQWAYTVSNASPTAQATGIKVAVLDTGVSPVPNMTLRNRANFITLGINNEPTTSTTDDFLPNGHGTAVAALIASQTYGVAPGAYIVPVKTCDLHGDCDDITVTRGICYAQAVGADVINVSLGTLVNAPIVRQAIREVTARGSLVVAASGNTNQFTGQRKNKPNYPAYWASLNGLISVGAIDKRVEYGDFATANRFVELVAPGADLQLGSLPAADSTGIESYSPTPAGVGSAAFFEGTSFAAPFLAAAAANLYAQCPILRRNNISGPSWIENALKITATAWTPVSQDSSRTLPASFLPTGLIDITNALSLPCP